MTENTLRDQFAMAALTGLLGSNAVDTKKVVESPASVCWAAYRFADTMIEARQKTKAKEGAEA